MVIWKQLPRQGAGGQDRKTPFTPYLWFITEQNVSPSPIDGFMLTNPGGEMEPNPFMAGVNVLLLVEILHGESSLLGVQGTNSHVCQEPAWTKKTFLVSKWRCGNK